MPPLYILRHGETVWNRSGRLQGTLNSPLTALGQVQAARQGAILRRIVSLRCNVQISPQGRARQTAALAGLTGRMKEGLREIGLGDWEGRLISELEPPPGVLWKFTAPGGEDAASAEARVAHFLAELTGPTIVVTHGVTSILLRARTLGTPRSGWDAMDDPQGVVHWIENGRETLLR
ncbi:probable phosphoglycerate mutase [Jannaschia faecimaris]|uniref:Probable phosphoglycerate mutase n=1 Tax=Jannaschia faecimaris TaxID=1244108 RepID=A0A1H3SH64_9RHOB|nr:histidine phosphatase family protein [Jannaschia faecimaris]SDZ37264.1 probable phosphoglycerate mutase [Jannaschia faecimaris]